MNPASLLLPLLLTVATTASAASVTLRAGQTATLGNKKITVLRVQDNRCPPNADCIRAGEMIAKVLVSAQGKTSFLILQFPEKPNTAWAGVRLQRATFDKIRQLTFTDER